MDFNKLLEYYRALSLSQQLSVLVATIAPFLGLLWGALTAFTASYNGLPNYVVGNWMVAIYASAILCGLLIFWFMRFFRSDSVLYHPIILNNGDGNFFMYIMLISNSIKSCALYIITSLTTLIFVSEPNFIMFYVLFSLFFMTIAYLLKTYYITNKIRWFAAAYDEAVKNKVIEAFFAGQNGENGQNNKPE